MTQEQEEIIFTRVIEAENKLLTAARNYGNNSRIIEKSAAVYYALFQIVKDLDLGLNIQTGSLMGRNSKNEHQKMG